jgi:thymidine kinase
MEFLPIFDRHAAEVAIYPFLLIVLGTLNLLLLWVPSIVTNTRRIFRYTPPFASRLHREGGHLVVYTGPMFCGKTSRLIADLTRYADILPESKVVMVNHAFDVRDRASVISSHSSTYKGLSSKITVLSNFSLQDLDLSAYAIIGIDEAQFFEDLIPAVELLLQAGKQVYVAGLDSDYRRQIFGHVHELLHMADTFVKLEAICTSCLTGNRERVEAAFTAKRLRQGPIVTVGGSETYYPVCRYHHSSE